jgi:hypothetical protein
MGLNQFPVIGFRRIAGSEDDPRDALGPERSEQFILSLRAFTVIRQQETVVRRLQHLLYTANRAREKRILNIWHHHSDHTSGASAQIPGDAVWRIAKSIGCPDYPVAQILSHDVGACKNPRYGGGGNLREFRYIPDRRWLPRDLRCFAHWELFTM